MALGDAGDGDARHRGGAGAGGGEKARDGD